MAERQSANQPPLILLLLLLPLPVAGSSAAAAGAGAPRAGGCAFVRTMELWAGAAAREPGAAAERRQRWAKCKQLDDAEPVRPLPLPRSTNVQLTRRRVQGMIRISARCAAAADTAVPPTPPAALGWLAGAWRGPPPAPPPELADDALAEAAPLVEDPDEVCEFSKLLACSEEELGEGGGCAPLLRRCHEVAQSYAEPRG